MVNNSLESLLQPTLSVDQPKNSMYSVTSHVLVAFFGGIFGILLFSMLSLRHIGRLKPYLKYYLFAFLLAFCFFGILGYLYIIGQWPDWLMISSSEKASIKTINRIVGVSTFGVIYLFQKQFFSVSAMLGSSPNPWKPAISFILLGMGMQFVAVILFTLIIPMI